MLTKTLAEKGRLLLLPKPLPRKDKPILETYKANHKQSRSHKTKPIKTTANQNASEENTAKRKSREPENLLAEKILTKTAYLKKCHR